MKNGRKVASWMIEYGADFVLERITSDERACDIGALRIATQAAAEQHWLPLMETRKARREAQIQIQKKATAGRFQKDVRRRLKHRDLAVTHLVNESFYDAEEHWDDQEWMFTARRWLSLSPTLTNTPRLPRLSALVKPGVGSTITSCWHHLMHSASMF